MSRRRVKVPSRIERTPGPAERLEGYRQAGARAAGGSRLREPALLASFESWLESKGTSTEAWAAMCASSGRPTTLTVALATAYLADQLDGSRKPRSASNRFTTLIGALRRAGWEVDAVRTARSRRQSAMTTMVKAATAQMDCDDVRRAQVRARPLTTKMITAMMKHLELLRCEREVSDIWATWMRALVLCGFAAALRINEIARMEWSWCTFSVDGVVIEIPRSKATSAPKQVFVPRGTTLCPVAALEALRSAYAECTANPGHVFAVPSFQKHLEWQRRRDVSWVDIIEDHLSDPAFHPGCDGDVRLAAAERSAVKRITRQFEWFLNECGVHSRSVFERPTSHGLRRGCATELANAGVGIIDIAKHLRHKSPAVTSIYIEGADLHVIDPAAASKPWTRAEERAFRRSLSELAERLSPTASASSTE